jgi:hypothetical protein
MRLFAGFRSEKPERGDLSVPPVNVQALVALALFLGALLVARLVMNIQRGQWPGGIAWIAYLRCLLGFLMAAAIAYGLASFAGIDLLSGALTR